VPYAHAALSYVMLFMVNLSYFWGDSDECLLPGARFQKLWIDYCQV
jgi:hypothetical protein